MSDEKNLSILRDAGYEDVVVFRNPDYDDALIGVSEDNRAVYDFWKMVECLCRDDGMDNTEAIEFIEFNTIRALPYVEDSPIIMYGINHM